MKKILFLFCGGTITMKRDKNGTLIPVNQDNTFLNNFPSLNKIAKISFENVVNIDSSNFNPDLWVRLCKILKINFKKYDGFVIVHGTDTMSYTASYLTFAIKNLKKPIVFTGAQKPIFDLANDATNNLINATLVAAIGIPEIYIVFGSKILKANRSTKISESSLDAFDSPMYPPLGEIALEVKLVQTKKIIPNKETVFVPVYNNKILIATIFPGINSEEFIKTINKAYLGIIIRAFGPGNIPNSFISVLKKAKLKEIPILILSQCQKGITKMQLYKVGHQAQELGAVSGYDMTLEAAVTKLMWILGKYSNFKEIKDNLTKNLSGELTI